MPNGKKMIITLYLQRLKTKFFVNISGAYDIVHFI